MIAKAKETATATTTATKRSITKNDRQLADYQWCQVSYE
tara:strand:+ start:242 stop:358 length:117 start_codon:yes stop_codon:yes gene_type:complete